MATYRKASFKTIQAVVSESQSVRLQFANHPGSVLMDLFTASAIVKVHGAASADNKAKIERMVETPNGLSKVAAACMKVLS